MDCKASSIYSSSASAASSLKADQVQDALGSSTTDSRIPQTCAIQIDVEAEMVFNDEDDAVESDYAEDEDSSVELMSGCSDDVTEEEVEREEEKKEEEEVGDDDDDDDGVDVGTPLLASYYDS